MPLMTAAARRRAVPLLLLPAAPLPVAGQAAESWDPTLARGHTTDRRVHHRRGAPGCPATSRPTAAGSLRPAGPRLPGPRGGRRRRAAHAVQRRRGELPPARTRPTARRIAFVSDRARAEQPLGDGCRRLEPRAVFTDPAVRVVEPAWAPDGRHVVVRRQALRGASGGSGIWSYDVETGEGRELLGASQRGAAWPSLSRDGAVPLLPLPLPLGAAGPDQGRLAAAAAGAGDGADLGGHLAARTRRSTAAPAAARSPPRSRPTAAGSPSRGASPMGRSPSRGTASARARRSSCATSRRGGAPRDGPDRAGHGRGDQDAPRAPRLRLDVRRPLDRDLAGRQAEAPRRRERARWRRSPSRRPCGAPSPSRRGGTGGSPTGPSRSGSPAGPPPRRTDGGSSSRRSGASGRWTSPRERRAASPRSPSARWSTHPPGRPTAAGSPSRAGTTRRGGTSGRSPPRVASPCD